MAVPQSEKEIVQMLNLTEIAHNFPRTDKEETVIVLEGKDYPEAAMIQAITLLDNTVLREVLQYPHALFSHNNVPGHGSFGGDLSIRSSLSILSEDIRKRVKSLR